jgi:hypothetical protein
VGGSSYYTFPILHQVTTTDNYTISVSGGILVIHDKASNDDIGPVEDVTVRIAVSKIKDVSETTVNATRNFTIDVKMAGDISRVPDDGFWRGSTGYPVSFSRDDSATCNLVKKKLNDIIGK